MKRLIVVAIALVLTVALVAQHYQADFPPDEFRARWNRVLRSHRRSKPSPSVQGVPMTNGYQSAAPAQLLLLLVRHRDARQATSYLDGRTRRVTLNLPPR